MAIAAPLSDSPAGYGLVTRALHWGMAGLFVWQFTSALLRVFAEDTAIEGFFWSTHYSVGFTLWLLVFLRGAWGLANLRRRPAPEASPAMATARHAGHLTLYLLMIVVPTLAVLRAVGGTRGFSVYGVQLVAPRETGVAWLTAPGDALHGLLGWGLLALIVGHVTMALFHARIRRDGTLDRMTRGQRSAELAPGSA